MEKEFEIKGCISSSEDITYDEFWDKFIGFVEANGWSFGGGIDEIIDGYYVDEDGLKLGHVLEDFE